MSKESEYIQKLELENARLKQENSTLKQILSQKQTQSNMMWIGINLPQPFPRET